MPLLLESRITETVPNAAASSRITSQLTGRMMRSVIALLPFMESPASVAAEPSHALIEPYPVSQNCAIGRSSQPLVSLPPPLTSA